MDFFRDNWLEVYAILLSASPVAAAITRLTPTKKDDAVVGKVVRFLEKVGSLFLKRF